MARSRRSQALLQFSLFCGILLFINILASTFYAHLDLTEEKRFTLTQPTKRMLKEEVKDRIYVEVMLKGEFPAGFKRLQTAVREMLDDFRSVNGNIDYAFVDPNAGDPEQVNAHHKELANQGILPINLKVNESATSKRQLVYPYAILRFGSRQEVVKLLENNSPTISPEVVVNNSVSLLEYKFANGLKQLLYSGKRPIILYTKGHGELDELQTADLDASMRQFYDVDRVRLDSSDLKKLGTDCALMIVAKPQTAFSEKDKFMLDQYVMNGGKVLWLIDRLAADLDSLRRSPPRFLPTDYPLNLEDILFKYGVRIKPDLVLDAQCTRIPKYVGQSGNGPQFEMFKFQYFPAVQPTSQNPIVKSLGRVEFHFCSSIELIKTKTDLKKEVILASSPYSNFRLSPIVDLAEEIDDSPEKFNKGPQPLGVLLEGTFPSNFENRATQELVQSLQNAGIAFKTSSVPNRMIVISDGDVAANYVRDRPKKQYDELGLNRFESEYYKTTVVYSNKDLMLNAIQYLIEPSGVIEARTREVKLRPLDTTRAQREKTMWQALNLGLPLVLLGLLGWLFLWLRKRKYGRV